MKIENGRKFFYQWELNQRLIVDEPCTIVQFANGTMPNALGVAVKEENGVRYAEVPNILLQTAADLRAYAWDDTTTSVVGSTVFPVYHMEKPAQYAYTQTEIKQYDLLLKELEEKTGYYMPTVDEEGNLSWHKSMESLPDIKGANIRGPQGIQGEQGPMGKQGPRGEQGPQGVSVMVLTGTDENPVILSLLAEGLYHLRGKGKHWSGDTLRTLSTGFYSVSIFGVSRQLVILPVAGTRRVRYGYASEIGTHWEEETVDVSLIAQNYEQIAALEKEVIKLDGQLNKSYELIEEVTLEEDVSSFLRTTEPNGKAYNFSAIRMFIRTAQSAGTAQLIFNIGSGTSSSYVYYQKNNILVSGKEQDAVYRQYNDNGRMYFEGAAGAKNNVGYFETRPTYWDREWKNVTRISLIVSSDAVSIPAGTTIKIYGIRG